MVRPWCVVALLAFAIPARADDLDACTSAAEQAQPLQRAKKLRAAREVLDVCSRPVCPNVIRADCTKWMAEVEAAMPKVVFRAQDPAGAPLVQVRVSVDGSIVARSLDGEALPFDPGDHMVRFEAEGAPAVDQAVKLSVGERRDIRAILDVPVKAAPVVTRPSGFRVPVGAWIVGGAGAAFAGAGAVLWIVGLSERSSLQDRCGNAGTCSQSEVDGSKAKLIAGDVMFFLGLGGLGAAVVLTLVSKPSASSVAVTPLPGGALGSYSARF